MSNQILLLIVTMCQVHDPVLKRIGAEKACRKRLTTCVQQHHQKRGLSANDALNLCTSKVTWPKTK